jgi:hypothetical protein
MYNVHYTRAIYFPSFIKKIEKFQPLSSEKRNDFLSIRESLPYTICKDLGLLITKTTLSYSDKDAKVGVVWAWREKIIICRRIRMKKFRCLG